MADDESALELLRAALIDIATPCDGVVTVDKLRAKALKALGQLDVSAVPSIDLHARLAWLAARYDWKLVADPGRRVEQIHRSVADQIMAQLDVSATPTEIDLLRDVAHAAFHLMDDSGELDTFDDNGVFDYMHSGIDHERLSAALDALEASGWEAHPDG